MDDDSFDEDDIDTQDEMREEVQHRKVNAKNFIILFRRIILCYLNVIYGISIICYIMCCFKYNDIFTKQDVTSKY